MCRLLGKTLFLHFLCVESQRSAPRPVVRDSLGHQRPEFSGVIKFGKVAELQI